MKRINKREKNWLGKSMSPKETEFFLLWRHLVVMGRTTLTNSVMVWLHRATCFSGKLLLSAKFPVLGERSLLRGWTSWKYKMHKGDFIKSVQKGKHQEQYFDYIQQSYYLLLLQMIPLALRIRMGWISESFLLSFQDSSKKKKGGGPKKWSKAQNQIKPWIYTECKEHIMQNVMQYILDCPWALFQCLEDVQNHVEDRILASKVKFKILI